MQSLESKWVLDKTTINFKEEYLIMKKLVSLVKAFMCSVLGVYADTTTATSVGGSGVQFTDGIRMVYSREIEFKALPIMRF